MTAMRRWPRRAERGRGARGWLLPAALLTLVPKCVLCVLGYAGLGAALRLGGPELCGGASTSTLPWVLGLSALGGTLGLVWHRRS